MDGNFQVVTIMSDKTRAGSGPFNMYEAIGRAVERWARGGAILAVEVQNAGEGEPVFFIGSGAEMYWYDSAAEADRELYR